MATIHMEIEIAASRAFVWEAIRDVGEIHRRLVRGFVVDCRLESGARVVTFANGLTIRELIVSVDDATRRHAWSARGEPFVHHNASAQVFAAGANDERCRVEWIADVLPDEVAGNVREMMRQGLQAMKTTLESDAAGR